MSWDPMGRYDLLKIRVTADEQIVERRKQWEPILGRAWGFDCDTCDCCPMIKHSGRADRALL